MISRKKYLYVRNPWKKRDITIVSDILTKEGKTFVKCAWSFRHKADKFIKKEGREIVNSRFETGDPNFSAEFEIPSDKVRFYNIAANILANILSKDSTPKMYFNDILSDMHYYSYLSIELPEERKKHIEEAWKRFKLV